MNRDLPPHVHLASPGDVSIYSLAFVGVEVASVG